MSNKFKTIIYIASTIIVVATVIFFIFFYKATININTEPQSAQVEIAGYTSVGATEYKLNPGEYKLKVSLPGYVTYEKIIKLKMSQKVDYAIKLKSQPEAIKLIDYPAKFITLSEDKKSMLYISNEGRTAYILNHINTDTKSKPYAITPEVFGDVNKMIWHPSKRLAILKKNDDQTAIYDFGRYDLLNQEEKDFGSGIKGIAFSPDGEKILYFYAPDTGEKSLIRANKDNSGVERLIDLRQHNLVNPEVRWSDDAKYALLFTDQIFIVDMYLKNIKQLTQFSSVSNAGFTPNSSQIIYQQDNKLYLTDLNGENIKELNINTKLNKTVWGQSDILYYAYLDSETGSDKIASINIDTLETKEYDYNPKQPINIINPIISEGLDKLFFQNNGYAYSLELVNRKYE